MSFELTLTDTNIYIFFCKFLAISKWSLGSSQTRATLKYRVTNITSHLCLCLPMGNPTLYETWLPQSLRSTTCKYGRI